MSRAKSETAVPFPSATIAICCRLPDGIRSSHLEDWIRPARAASVDVTWVVGPDDLSLASDACLEGGRSDTVALHVPREWTADDAGRGLLRGNLASVRRRFAWLDSLVLDGASSRGDAESLRSELLSELGFRVVAVPELCSTERRRSRRPAPKGWSCRNPAWGLWEVAFTSRRQGLLQRWLPLVSGPRLVPGSLVVLGEGTEATKGHRESRHRFERMVHWASRQVAFGRPPARLVTLSRLGELLAGGSAGGGRRSILAA